jgi:transposase
LEPDYNNGSSILYEDIRKNIENRGYRCIYLPPYSSELNPIEQFWSIYKSKLKRKQLLEEAALTTRIQMACNQILVGGLRGFCKYSIDKFDDYLNRMPI